MSLSRRGLLAVLALAGAMFMSLTAGALAVVPGSTLSCTPASIQPGQSTTCTTALAVSLYSTVSFASDLSGASAPPCTLAPVGGVSFECSSTVTLTTAGTHHITSTANSIGGCIPVIPGICIPIGIAGPPLVSNPFTVIVGAAGGGDQPSPL